MRLVHAIRHTKDRVAFRRQLVITGRRTHRELFPDTKSDCRMTHLEAF